ncbi:MAG TPA: hypothetical protein VGK71_01390 [Nitrospirota bacterium]
MKQTVTVEEWVNRFRAVGLDDEKMAQWHEMFERENSEGHQSFLEWLGLPAGSIKEIRGRHA